MALTAGTGALGAGLLGATNLLNGTNSTSTGISDSWGGSWGASANSAYTNSDAWSLMKAVEDSQSSSWGETGSQSSSRTYGREASAQDIENAAKANQIQRDLWSEQADYNAKQADIDREFQREMSNTAYQRAVADLLKAGLNPILAVGNMGASTPVGAMASSGLATAHKANAYPESESSSTSYGSSGSSAWSHGESGSASKSKTRSKSEGWSKNGSSEGSHSEQKSNSTTQLMSLLASMNDTVNNITNTAKNAIKDAKNGTNRNGVAGWQSYKKK